MTKSAPFSQLVETLEGVRKTSSKKAKVSLLSAYLRPLSPPDAQTAARISSGRSSERGSKEEAQVGYSTLLDVVKDLTGSSSTDVSKAYLNHGDLGEVAEELLGAKKEQTLFEEPLALADLDESFQRLRSSKGQGSSLVRKGVVKSLLLRATPKEAKYIVKVLTGEMRTGLVSGLLEESISEAYGIPKQEAARTHMILGDIGLLAKSAAEGTLGEIKMQVFRPVNFMLAEPMAEPSEISAHFGKAVYAEFKYDGVRAQVHRRSGEVRVYSRRLEDITPFFPEIVSAFSRQGKDVILDGEIVPFKDGRPLPFQLLQRRLRRVDKLEEAARNSPVVYFAFDMLFEDGEETASLPLRLRREKLKRELKGTGASQAESVPVTTTEEISAAFRKSRDLGYEGLVVKDPDSLYSMGKRGSGWVKLKEELDTLDVVIVGAEYGHGKRAGVISDYTFAVRDGSTLKTIGKAYSGLTDVEIDEMTNRLKEITVQDYGYHRTVKPEIVLEVAFDSIQRSSRHDSGYALRFPRIKRIRTDKSPADINTIADVEKIFTEQSLKLDER
jgi:DNA ligase 1